MELPPEGLLRAATDGLDDEPDHDETHESESNLGDGGNGGIRKTGGGGFRVRNRRGDARGDGVTVSESGSGDEREREGETLEGLHCSLPCWRLTKGEEPRACQ